MHRLTVTIFFHPCQVQPVHCVSGPPCDRHVVHTLQTPLPQGLRSVHHKGVFFFACLVFWLEISHTTRKQCTLRRKKRENNSINAILSLSIYESAFVGFFHLQCTAEHIDHPSTYVYMQGWVGGFNTSVRCSKHAASLYGNQFSLCDDESTLSGVTVDPVTTFRDSSGVISSSPVSPPRVCVPTPYCLSMTVTSKAHFAPAAPASTNGPRGKPHGCADVRVGTDTHRMCLHCCVKLGLPRLPGDSA